MSNDAETAPVKVSQAIIDHAREAKMFIRESGEAPLPDELLVRASVAFNQMHRREANPRLRSRSLASRLGWVTRRRNAAIIKRAEEKASNDRPRHP